MESLRLVDAIQTFGPDYELLVTSEIKATPSILGGIVPVDVSISGHMESNMLVFVLKMT